MNWKVILGGGLAMYVAQFLMSMLTGSFIHENILNDAYMANASFWRPELNQDPPDMAALMPLWITMGLISSFVIASIYSFINGAFCGSAVVKGAKFGLMVWAIQAMYTMGLSGIFNLPYEIWLWWLVEFALMGIVGGIVLAVVAEKLSNKSV